MRDDLVGVNQKIPNRLIKIIFLSAQPALLVKQENESLLFL